MRRINTRAELLALHQELGLRPDWHEPDEQDITAEVRGTPYDFDNAMSPGENYGSPRETRQELHVVLRRYQPHNFEPGEEVAVVNLATLFAWATGYEAPPAEVDLSPRELDSLKVQQLRGRVHALEELVTSLRPMIETASQHQWGLVLRDLNNLLPK